VATVVGAFETRAMAERAVNDLMAAGFRADQLSVLGRHGEVADLTPEAETATRTATGAGIGAAVGGLGSLLLGVGALAIPGIGPVLAVGAWGSALSLALGGGLVGGLIGFLSAQGIPPEQAELYAERVQAGAYLVAVHPDAGEEAKAESVLANAGAEGPIRRGAPGD
jgi:hypothetical protein